MGCGRDGEDGWGRAWDWAWGVRGRALRGEGGIGEFEDDVGAAAGFVGCVVGEVVGELRGSGGCGVAL